MGNVIPTGGSGSHGEYLWITAGHFQLSDLLEICPRFVAEQYIAITSLDSGAVRLDDKELAMGWQSRGDVAYSPRIESANAPLAGLCGGFDEWFISRSPLDLGRLSHENPFENNIVPRKVFALVNFPDLRLHEGESNPLVKLFWEQLAWIQPESYVSDGDAFLTFVSRNKNTFASVVEALGKPSEDF
jgi:hypothetical protein